MRAGWLLFMTPLALASCQSEKSPSQLGQPARGFEPPVITNPESPVEYPTDLFEQQVEGVVLLRLYVTASGTLVPDSTRIEESSGFPELDSAALRSVDQLQFAPARRNGIPVATAFVQPVHFRHPELTAQGENQ
ncbi:MAG: energy transducer TonB [Gemmatimonadetes bacterium]|nr:energy transducer TonB [Gemmatimonadota bacterium]MCH8143169.1 energy transducer TonB [Gemmatimonadota bacterium]MCH8934374.1 energy transducer TonB [Gemmatimonadota bacterium]MCH8938132.1 energy transducer TonB [Gemmatimonadota bacterium]